MSAPRPPGVLGFSVQCDRCPQKALIASQVPDVWVCPRCAEATDTVNDIRRPHTPVDAESDDDYLRKIQG